MASRIIHFDEVVPCLFTSLDLFPTIPLNERVLHDWTWWRVEIGKLTVEILVERSEGREIRKLLRKTEVVR